MVPNDPGTTRSMGGVLLSRHQATWTPLNSAKIHLETDSIRLHRLRAQSYNTAQPPANFKHRSQVSPVLLTGYRLDMWEGQKREGQLSLTMGNHAPLVLFCGPASRGRSLLVWPLPRSWRSRKNHWLHVGETLVFGNVKIRQEDWWKLLFFHMKILVVSMVSNWCFQAHHQLSSPTACR